MLPTPRWEEATTRWGLCHPHGCCLCVADGCGDAVVCGGEDSIRVPRSRTSFPGREGGREGVEIARPGLAVGADRKSGGLQFDVSPLSARTGFQRIHTWSRKGLLPS